MPNSSRSSATPLCWADDATFWPWRRWPEFSRWPEPAQTLVIVPMAGMADWGLGHALDAEELLLTHVLATALQRHPPAPTQLLVIPPLRFVFGPAKSCAFGMSPPTVHRLLDEVVDSIHLSGFRRIVLYNASPWNEELTAAAARDLRISRRLQMFRISLSGLGFDFHPTRSPDRRRVQTVLTALTGKAPETSTVTHPASLTEALIEAPPLLEAAADQLASLIAEIQAWPALPDAGRIPSAQPPT